MNAARKVRRPGKRRAGTKSGKRGLKRRPQGAGAPGPAEQDLTAESHALLGAEPGRRVRKPARGDAESVQYPPHDRAED